MSGLARLRRAIPADAAGIAAVHQRCWYETYTGILRRDLVLGREPHEFTCLWTEALAPLSTWRSHVVEIPHGPILGFATAGPIREPEGDADGELIALYVLRRHQREGLGRILFEAARDTLATAGYRSMVARALGLNPACGFYEHLGGRVLADAERPFRGVLVHEMSYVWTLDAATP